MEKQTTKKGKEFKAAYESFIKSGRTCVGMVAVLEDAELSCQARVLFHIISSFCYVEGYCFASNETLAARLGFKRTMIKTYIKELQSNGLITTEIVTISTGNRRHIYLNFPVLGQRYLK